MAGFVERLWALEEHGQLSRRDRTPGRYLAYVPDELGTTLPRIGAGVWSNTPQNVPMAVRAAPARYTFLVIALPFSFGCSEFFSGGLCLGPGRRHGCLAALAHVCHPVLQSLVVRLSDSHGRIAHRVQ